MDKYSRINHSKLDCTRISVIKTLINQAPVSGVLSEVGVYKGGTLRVIAEAAENRTIYGFDTFSGLPKEYWNNGEYHNPGEFGDLSYIGVKQALSDLKNVILIKGLFPQCVINTPIAELIYAFVHIDTDYYKSVLDSIKFFYPRMADNGIILFDDYQWKHCPGVEKAINDFGLPITVVKHDYINQAYWINSK